MKIFQCPICNGMAVQSSPGYQKCTGANCSFECEIGITNEQAIELQMRNKQEFAIQKEYTDAVRFCKQTLCKNCRSGNDIENCQYSGKWCKKMLEVIHHVKRKKLVTDMWETVEWFSKYIQDHPVARPVLNKLMADLADYERTKSEFTSNSTD